MDLRQLKVFKEVAQLGSFTRAAESLHIAQPAVSVTVRKLEEELELTLLNRREKTVTLTAEGEVLLGHITNILDNCKVAENEMAELRGLQAGEVTIGITPMMSAYFFPRIIMAFRKQYPGLKLTVNGEGATSIHKKIISGELDMGVIARRMVTEGLEYQNFLREEIVVGVPADSPYVERGKIKIADFLKEPLIVFKQGYYMRELLDELAQQNKIQPNIVFETNLFSLVGSLIKEKLGISTFLRMVIRGESQLVPVSFDPPLHLDLVIAWKEKRYLSRANRVFRDFLLEKGREQEIPS